MGGTDSRTHALTDVQTQLQCASNTVFTARTHARAVLGVVIMSIRPSVCHTVDCDETK